MKAFTFIDKTTSQLLDVPMPIPTDNDVVIRLRYAALNHRDNWIRKGLYSQIVYPVICGSDGVGEIIEVGSAVPKSALETKVLLNPNIAWGDSTLAQSKHYAIRGMPTQGTLAEYICVPYDRVVQIPPHLSMEQAAALPLAGLTAYRAMFTQGKCSSNDTVLLTGIGGGVALFALLFAQHCGAKVFCTSGSEAKLQNAKELGALDGVLYSSVSWEQEIREKLSQYSCTEFDLIIDGTGGDSIASYVRLLKPGGRLVCYGATLGSPKTIDMHKIFWKQLHIIGSTMGSDEDFHSMVSYIQQNTINPIVDSIFPLSSAHDAFERMDSASQFGKILIDCTA